MMAYKRSESTWDNFGKFIHQFQPEIKTLIRKLESILIKLYRQNVSLLFNQACLNEILLPNYTHTIYIYISAQWVECSQIAWETRVQSHIKSYQRLKKKKRRYLMPPGLTFRIIRYRSRLSRAIQRKE